jgi:hypothetical protein
MMMPESIAAAIEATIGKPTVADFMTMSPVNLPVEARKHFPRSALLMIAMPMALSTALWRPISSAKATRVPFSSKIAAAWTPPVFRKTGAEFSLLTQASIVSALTLKLDLIFGILRDGL